jgi:hypothetical protein
MVQISQRILQAAGKAVNINPLSYCGVLSAPLNNKWNSQVTMKNQPETDGVKLI